MTRILPVALVQAPQRPFSDDLAPFAAEVEQIVDPMPAGSLVAYPEVHLFGRDGVLTSDRLRDISQPMDGGFVRRLGEIAGDLHIWLMPGSIVEPTPAGGVYNTSVVFNPEGELVTLYRKVFPWRPSEPYTPGDRFTTFEVPDLGRIGIAICYDIWFPEVVRQIAWMGADVVVNLVRTTTPDRAQELVLVRANAIANQLYMLSVNAAAPMANGQSLVVDPDGDVVAHAAHAGRDVIRVDVDFDRVAAIRRDGTAGCNRMWSHFRAGDQPIRLPIYDGRIDPETWNPDHRIHQQEERA